MKILCILIAAIPFVANAQDAKKNNPGKNITVGFSFSPDYSYRTLKNNDGSSSSEMIIDQRNDIEKGKLGFTTGLNLNIKVSKNLAIQTGIFYSDKGYRNPKQALSFSSPSPTEPTHVSTRYNLNYLDIPLKLNFISGRGKVTLIVGAGLAVNLFLNASTNVTYFYDDGREENRKQSSSVAYNKFNLSSLASVGFEYRLKDHISLRAEPTFRYGLSKTVDQPIAEQLWSVGLNMSIYIQLINPKE